MTVNLKLYDSETGIPQYLRSLAGLHDLIRLREEAYHRHESLQNFLLMGGKFALTVDGEFRRLSSRTTWEGTTAVLRVRKFDFIQVGVKITSEHRILAETVLRRFSLGFDASRSAREIWNWNFKLPAVGTACEICGSDWEIADCHEATEVTGRGICHFRCWVEDLYRSEVPAIRHAFAKAGCLDFTVSRIDDLSAFESTALGEYHFGHPMRNYLVSLASGNAVLIVRQGVGSESLMYESTPDVSRPYVRQFRWDELERTVLQYARPSAPAPTSA